MQKLGLLIFCDSPNQAEELASIARTLGYAIEHTFVQHSSDFSDELSNPSHQLGIITINKDRTSLPKNQNNSPDIPVIALTQDAAEFTTGDLIEAGFAEVAQLDDTRHIKYVINNRLLLLQSDKLLNESSSRFNQSQQQLMVLLQSSTQPIAFVHEGFHVFANPAYLQALGYSTLESLQAIPLLDLIPEAKQRQELSDSIAGLHNESASLPELFITFNASDEDQIIYQVLLTSSYFDGEQVSQIILDKPLEASPQPLLKRPQGRTLEISDPVTHLYAQHHMLKLLEDTVTHARDSSTEYMLYLVHLETGPDDIEYTNTCMQAAAYRLLDVIDDGDVLGRYTGNTFLLLSLFNKQQRPENYAQGLRSIIGDLDGLLQGTTHSRVTGVIIDKYCKDGENAIARLEDNFIQAQEYHQVVKIDSTQYIHTPGSQIMDDVWARRVSTILKNNRLTLTSLPIISLRHDEYERYTLQLQLSDESGDAVPLDHFRDTVIHTGLVSSVDRWIIFNAARQLVEKLHTAPTTQFFIPLVGNVMLEDNLYPWIEKVIKQFKLPSGSISLETSVDAALEYPEAFAEFCQKITAIKCGIYMTGLDDPTITHELYNNSKNKIQYLALDSKLLNGMTRDPAKNDAIEILVEQCHRENTLTVVPDVVEPELLSELWRLGVDLIISTNLMDQADDMLELDLTATLSA